MGPAARCQRPQTVGAVARAAGAVGHGQAGPPPGGPQQRPATVDDAGGQAASSPRSQQHVSTGHEDLQEGDADAPTHTPAEDPPQPNHPQRPRQDTPDTRPRTPNPTTQRSTTRTRHPRSQARQRAPPVLTTNKYRSHDEQVPFSRRTSTVLTEGRAAAPNQPPPCPYQERPDSQASPRPAAPGPSAARRRPGATAHPPRTAPPPPPAAAGGRRPARRSRPSTRAPRGG